ncbi:MAG: flagellar biosynthesis regulator FlaF [Alphaproteobacteria bacterium]|nr:flagellar biosynthesis regulator FlaF [Alphaproteobacteria bacterium]
MSSNNPYSNASDAYGTTAAATDQRSLEGQILLKAAQKLEDMAKRLEAGENPSLEESGETLTYNQKLWQFFVGEMMNSDHSLPLDIKNNIASLAVFVFKRTQEIMIDMKPEKFKALININRNIAAGLMSRKPQAETPKSKLEVESQKEFVVSDV